MNWTVVQRILGLLLRRAEDPEQPRTGLDHVVEQALAGARGDGERRCPVAGLEEAPPDLHLRRHPEESRIPYLGHEIELDLVDPHVHVWKNDPMFEDGSVVLEFNCGREMRQYCEICGSVRYVVFEEENGN